MVVCLERGADLHMAQLMPLPLTVSCFSKIQIGFTFLVPAHPGSPGQSAVKRVCVCVCVCVRACVRACVRSCVRVRRVVTMYLERTSYRRFTCKNRGGSLLCALWCVAVNAECWSVGVGFIATCWWRGPRWPTASRDRGGYTRPNSQGNAIHSLQLGRVWERSKMGEGDCHLYMLPFLLRDAMHPRY